MCVCVCPQNCVRALFSMVPRWIFKIFFSSIVNLNISRRFRRFFKILIFFREIYRYLFSNLKIRVWPLFPTVSRWISKIFFLIDSKSEYLQTFLAVFRNVNFSPRYDEYSIFSKFEKIQNFSKKNYFS